MRDRAIAEKIRSQNPDELLDKMKQTLDEAENSVGKWNEARPDFEAARKDYERARGYRSGDLNTIDLYLILNSINRNIEMGHQHHQKAIEESRLAQERATPVHHTGFGSSGSRSFGGGRMGGGSRGGGKW